MGFPAPLATARHSRSRTKPSVRDSRPRWFSHRELRMFALVRGHHYKTSARFRSATAKRRCAGAQLAPGNSYSPAKRVCLPAQFGDGEGRRAAAPAASRPREGKMLSLLFVRTGRQLRCPGVL